MFSNPQVIRRIQADFVPVALKAALVNNPPNDEEGELYREIGRSKPAPQGICVVNPACKVLDWALMFDDDKSVVAFLDHCLKRFAHYPDAKQPVDAERYMRFPSEKLDDVADTRQPLPVLDAHPTGRHCPGTPPLPPGTLIARLYGRALDANGKPVADTVRQEHYVEDRFHVSVELQKSMSIASAGKDQRFPLPKELGRLLANHAYLGQLDVNPVGAPGGKGELKRCAFWAMPANSGDGRLLTIRIEGETEAVGGLGNGDAGDGRMWEHTVKLKWEGLVEFQGDRVARILLVARGQEKLKWGNRLMGLGKDVDVTHLPGGHPIDLACGVRYGIVAEPAPASHVAVSAPAALSGLPVQVTEHERRQLVEAFGPPFIVFQARVQDELRLSSEQKEKLQDRLANTIRDAQQFFQKLNDNGGDRREKEAAAYRERVNELLTAFLQGALNRDQLKRLEQLELQQQGAFVLMRDDLVEALDIRPPQRQRFINVIQDLEKQVQPLIQQAQAGGRPEDIRPKIMQLKREHERKLEALLSEAQAKQWQAMLGKPITLDD